MVYCLLASTKRQAHMAQLVFCSMHGAIVRSGSRNSCTEAQIREPDDAALVTAGWSN